MQIRSNFSVSCKIINNRESMRIKAKVSLTSSSYFSLLARRDRRMLIGIFKFACITCQENRCPGVIKNKVRVTSGSGVSKPHGFPWHGSVTLKYTLIEKTRSRSPRD